MQAIVIKKIPIKENDELIICYTHQLGKQLYRTKSSLLPTSKQGPHLQVLNYVDFSLIEGQQHSNYPIITSACALYTYTGIKSSLKAMGVAYFFVECFDKLVFDNEPDEKLWEFIFNLLDDLNGIAKQKNTNFKIFLQTKYKDLMRVMGHDENTQTNELHHSTFPSLTFFHSMI